jgi:DNA-binding GntR family transcriptional regulator
MIIGKLLPGDTISIRTLALEHGMSAMPVREALKQLAMEKALSGAAKRAYRVPDLTARQASNLFEIRAVLEGGAAEAATPNITTKDLVNLRKWTAVMDATWQVGDAARFLDANFKFHSLIYSRAGNEDLCDLIANLLVRTGPWLAGGILSLASKADWRGEHDKIANALESGDSARARALIEDDARWGMTFFRG